MNFTTDEIAQLVLLIGAISGAAVAIIKALKENTAEVKVGNDRAAGADEAKLAMMRTAENADAEKVALSRAIAQPFAEPASVATSAADPLLGRIEAMEKELADLRRLR
jgi:hypothetical protein